MADIIMAGTGGQGVLTAGKILIDIAAADDKNVSWTSFYSAEMRGGTAACCVVVSEDEIGTPYPDKFDILFAMTEDAYKKYIGDMRDGGKVIVNQSLFSTCEFPENIEVYGVEASGIANEMGNSRGANLALLGAMIKGTGMMDKKKFGETLDQYFAKKGKASAQNLECYNKGYERALKI
ncbi:2-oxoacid:acceptor oxidoreductase family protein [Gottschalkiaceae bacterium SANA]|nr:2-oxoacid:acceptor oxidoreductase family protein [Gottschalkiaceae bacterium SANA]